MNLPSHVTVCDVGPRDGLQNEKEPISTEDKLALINRLIAAGMPEVEVSSFVSPKWVPQMADAEQLFARVDRSTGAKLIGLIPNEKGYDRAHAAKVDGVRLVVMASETFQKKNVNRSVEDGMRECEAIARRAKSDGVGVGIGFGTSWGCPYEGHVDAARVVDLANQAIEAGMDEIEFADTTGMADPAHVASLIREARKTIPVEKITCHFHNTRNSGFANVLAALNEGVTRFDSSIAGLGGCPFAPKATGNICTEDLVHMLHAMGIGTGINLGQLVETAEWMEGVIGHTLPGLVMKAGLAYPELVCVTDK
ncbi:MAG TPA: hydroxymethylglutaryl-CoA lyase [Chloroflexota bacterium]|nr:hydroxymethylglutaryl-CoA lyase [Chloroflexota bacterium]